MTDLFKDMAEPIRHELNPVERLKLRMAEYGEVTDSSNEEIILLRLHAKMRPDCEILAVASEVSKWLSQWNINHTISYTRKVVYLEWRRSQS